MKMKAKLQGACVTILLVLAACTKPQTQKSENFLTIDYGLITIKNTAGSRHDFTIQSNTNWTLSINPVSANWLTLDNFSGNGSKSIYASATKENINGAPRIAEIIATAINDPSLDPVHLTVIQNDTLIIK